MVVVSGIIPRGRAGGCGETVDGVGKELGHGFGGEGTRGRLGRRLRGLYRRSFRVWASERRLG